MAPKLSVITPSFNQGKFLERTIRSVLDQGYPNLEYVIVDGGSTDESVEIIRRYEDQLAWWVSEPDSGQTAAINRGIEGTTGEIVAYLNSDDYYLPGAFEAAIVAFERSGAGWVAGAAVDVVEGSDPRPTGLLRPDPPSASEGLLGGRFWWMLRPWAVPQPAAFWRREVFDRHGHFRLDMHYAFDAEFMIRLALAGESPEYLPNEILAVRSVHPDQKSANMRHWRPEENQMLRQYLPQLTRREQRRYALIRWPHAAYTRVQGWVTQPALTFAGDMLEHVPERWRPPIRTRDRRARVAAREIAQLELTSSGPRRKGSRDTTVLPPRAKPLRVCIDARLRGGMFGGIEQAIIGLAAGLSKLDDGDEEYLFLTHPEQDEWIRPYLKGPCSLLHTRMEYAGQGGPARVRRAIRERLPPGGLRRAVTSSDGIVERAGVEVMHLMVQDAFVTDIPSIYEPHDLQHLHLPELFSARSRARRETVYRAHCERAALVVALSSWGKQDLIDSYGLSPDKVCVVPRGSVLSEYPEPSDHDLDQLRSRLSLPEAFLLYPAQTWPHKNHERLLEALALVRDREGVTISLVCPGRRNRHFRQIRERIRELDLEATTWFPGFVSPLEVRGLYQLATGLIFPSRFEGWGMPLCEAFSADLPVAASTATSLPALAGDAALLFDPDDAEEIADRALRLWTDPGLRATLVERGRRRGALFSLDHAARVYRAHYRRLGQRPLSEEDRLILARPPSA